MLIRNGSTLCYLERLMQRNKKTYLTTGCIEINFTFMEACIQLKPLPIATFSTLQWYSLMYLVIYYYTITNSILLLRAE